MNEIARIRPQGDRPVSKKIGRNVRDIMYVRDINQVQLALSLGITESQVSRRISGKVDWTPEDIEKTAAVLGVKVERLFREPLAVDTEESSQITFRKLASVTPLFRPTAS